MKKLAFDTGGRPVNNEDFAVLQQELTDAVQAQFQSLGPCVVAGCQVSGLATAAAITPGIVLLDGMLVRFAGASNVALPAQFQVGAVVNSDPRPYQTGGTKNCMRELPAVVVAPNASYAGGQFLAVDTYGALTYWHRVQAKTRSKDVVEWAASVTTGNYDTDGLGKPGTEAWGWGLCNGQNGRADLRGHFVAGLDLGSSDYAAPGKYGGAERVTLTVNQLPAHAHQVTYNKTDSQLGGGNNDWSKIAAGHPQARSNTSTVNTEQTGGGQPFDNRPPYYVLAARQWVGY